LIIKPVMDRSLIESILFHPVIFDSISEDGAQQHIPHGHYIGGFVDDVCVGVVLVNFLSKNVADVVSLAANETKAITGAIGHVLEAAGTIQALASSNAAINIVVSRYEIV